MCDWVTIQIVFDGKFFDLRIDIKIKIGSIRKKFKEKGLLQYCNRYLKTREF